MKAKERYLAALHAMQSGVAALLSLGDYDGASPKHLRVGVNAAMVDHGALVGLLIEKKIFTLEEYEGKLADFMEEEVKSHESRLSRRFGKPVKLS